MDRNSNCQTCPTPCLSCSKEDTLVCNECKAGFWSAKCSMECFEGCLSDVCHISEGYCLKGCREGYSDALCDKRKNIYVYNEMHS